MKIQNIIKYLIEHEKFFNIILPICAMVLSIITICISIHTSKQQNKITLFDKRYEVYNETVLIKNFIDNYYKTLEYLPQNDSTFFKYYNSLWEGEIHPFTSDLSSVNNIINNQVNTIRQSKFLFPTLTQNELNNLDTYVNSYFSMTQQCNLLSTSDKDKYVILISGKTPQEILEECQNTFKQIDIQNIILKMENDLKLK